MHFSPFGPDIAFVERILGRQTNYVCPLPFDTCLAELHARSDPRRSSLLTQKGIYITIIYVNQNKYRYSVHEQWAYRDYPSYEKVRGTLERIDSQQTAVEIDYRLSPFMKTLLAILLIAGLVPFILAAKVPIFPLNNWLAQVILGLVFAGWVYDVLVLLTVMRSQRRVLEKYC